MWFCGVKNATSPRKHQIAKILKVFLIVLNSLHFSITVFQFFQFQFYPQIKCMYSVDYSIWFCASSVKPTSTTTTTVSTTKSPPITVSTTKSTPITTETTNRTTTVSTTTATTVKTNWFIGFVISSTVCIIEFVVIITFFVILLKRLKRRRRQRQMCLSRTPLVFNNG